MSGIMQVIVGASYLSSPVNTVAPAVTGTAQVRQTLSTTTGTWTGSPTSYSYQWKRGATNVGTNSSSYTLVAADAGSTMTCVVTANNTVGSGNATSNTTSTIAANIPLAPTIGTTTATAYNTAAVAYNAPSDNGGATITSYTATSSPGGITGTLSTSGSGTITVSGLTASTSYTFTVTATNSAGISSSSSSSNSITTPIAPPTTIGQAYGGGFYAGQISTTADGVATHYLIVAPKASGESSSRTWGGYGTTTGTTSVIDGPTNSASLSARGVSYEAARFCEDLTIGGYSDWYLPAKNEIEVLYYFLKPSNAINTLSWGANANAVYPEPISTNYTWYVPARTGYGIGFRTGETDAFTVDQYYWSSTENSSTLAHYQNFGNGDADRSNKQSNLYVRAVRRIPV